MNLRDITKNYYLNEKKNCAVSILLGANEFYNLNLGAEDYKLVVGFGGGAGCGYICGCLAGSIAVLGKLFSCRDNFRLICAKFVSLFEEELGSKNCCDIKKRFFNKETRCLEAVLKSVDLLESFIANLK